MGGRGRPAPLWSKGRCFTDNQGWPTEGEESRDFAAEVAAAGVFTQFAAVGL